MWEWKHGRKGGRGGREDAHWKTEESLINTTGWILSFWMGLSGSRSLPPALSYDPLRSGLQMTHNPVTLPLCHPSSTPLPFLPLISANVALVPYWNTGGNWHPALAGHSFHRASICSDQRLPLQRANLKQGYRLRTPVIAKQFHNTVSSHASPAFQAARAQARSVTPALLRTRGEEYTLSAAVWWERCAHTGWLTRWETKISFIGMLSAVMVVWLEASGCIDSWSGLINGGLSQ